jgi:hypothetical protein
MVSLDCPGPQKNHPQAGIPAELLQQTALAAKALSREN